MKLLLDTNIWSYVADANAVPDLLKASKNVEFLVAPAMVSEARAFPDPGLRKRLLEVMTHSRWKRLMPETYLEAEEIKSALLSVRPRWAAIGASDRDFKRGRYEFLRRSGGFWDKARDDAPLPVTNESLREASENALARQEVRDIRDKFKNGVHQDRTKHLQHVTIDAGRFILGTQTVDYWRLATAFHLKSELRIYAAPYREWLDYAVDVNAMLADEEQFDAVWFCELQPQQLKRQWLRASMEYLQRWHKPSDGSPADSQLASHLLDADYFVTADKNFAKCIEKIHLEAPFATAKAFKVSAGTKGIQELIEFSQADPLRSAAAQPATAT